MGKNVIKKKNGRTFLVNTMGKFERLNLQVGKVLVNRDISGLAPVRIRGTERKCFLVVEVTGWTPLERYLYAPMKPDVALALLWRMTRIAQACERFGLRYEEVCWDLRRMYVDGEGQLVMVYWPVTTLEQNEAGPLRFFLSFGAVLQQSGLHNSLMKKYIQFFYQRDVLDFSGFFRLVEDMVEQWKRMCNIDRQHDSKGEACRNSVGTGKRSPACGAWLEKPGKDQRYPLNKRQTRIGRGQDENELVLRGHAGVSNRHAVLSLETDGFYLTDLGSTNGTFVRGERIRPYTPILLQDGDLLGVGDVRLVFRKMEMSSTISVHQIRKKA